MTALPLPSPRSFGWCRSMHPILRARVERGAEHWHASPTSTCVVCTSADSSMYPDSKPGVSEAIKDALVTEFNVPPEVVYTRPDGLTTYHQAEDLHSWLVLAEPKARCSLIKLVTSDFNIVRAKRCFRKLFSVYVSEDEVVSGMRGEELLFQMDREHHIVREYRLQGWL